MLDVSFVEKEQDMSVSEKYLDICSIIGGTERIVRSKESVERISEELQECPARLDNRMYEIYGMSGKDMLEAFVKGYI